MCTGPQHWIIRSNRIQAAHPIAQVAPISKYIPTVATPLTTNAVRVGVTQHINHEAIQRSRREAHSAFCLEALKQHRHHPHHAMSLTTTLVNHSSGFDAALLELAHSRRSIYEHARISGEHRSAHRMLPVDRRESCGDALEAAYTRNMAKFLGERPPPAFASTLSMPVSRQERLLDEALLLAAHSRRSIYDTTRISGEHRSAHRMLPTDLQAERSDRCSDATDASYANAMANYFVTKSASRL
ncbi:hypothetical protein PHYPSEUDO_001086 [Phytophthora pseudosyringae]|uniref:Uncharacterized protein n=1 Tax=Phytophthora pseudosyringae TaxID=221518 RepID=A0A8T1V536_9STRA|nr:hypothetical protein PHYPSEUDO_001086 [Phytophthora pseudosyringae]